MVQMTRREITTTIAVFAPFLLGCLTGFVIALLLMP